MKAELRQTEYKFNCAYEWLIQQISDPLFEVKVKCGPVHLLNNHSDTPGPRTIHLGKRSWQTIK